MHKLIEYVCDELEDLEKKATKSGNLSASDVEYADKLASLKKNLLKGEKMYSEMEEYSGDYSDNMDGSYARGGNRSRRGANQYGSYVMGRNRNRDRMGRYSSEGGYSRAAEDMVMQLKNLMEEAPDEQTRMDIHRLIQNIESR